MENDKTTTVPSWGFSGYVRTPPPEINQQPAPNLLSETELQRIAASHTGLDDAGQLLHHITALTAKLELYETALRLLYNETAEYISINNLGNVHHNAAMQKARDALRGEGQRASQCSRENPRIEK